MNILKDVLSLKYGYRDPKRENFIFSINKCQHDCVDDDKIRTVLKLVYMSLFVVEEQIAFGSLSNFGAKPTIYKDQLHS